MNNAKRQLVRILVATSSVVIITTLSVGCSGGAKDDGANVPQDKKVSNFIYAPPNGKEGQPSAPGKGTPGLPPGVHK